MDSTAKTVSEHASPLFIVLNSGSGKINPADTRMIIEAMLNRAGREYELYEVRQGATLSGMTRKAVEGAVSCRGTVVAVGGDGTISTVARAALDRGCVFGVVPQGTFNYFARVHGIPEDTAAAMHVLIAGRSRPVQVGLVNGIAFLVNASLGLHPRMLEEREAFTKQYGRSRLAAIWSGLRTLLHYTSPLRLRIELLGTMRKVHTTTLFVCNNYLQLGQIGIPLTDEVAQGQLAALMLRPVGLPGMLWLVLRGALGQLGDARNVISFAFERMIVRRPGFYGTWRIKVGIDGEIHQLESPLEFRVSPTPLMLLVPSSE